MHHGWGYGMRGSFGGGTIMMGIFWIAIIAIVIYFFKGSNNSANNFNSQQSRSIDDPLEIAKRRYAQGEINKEELQEIKEELLK